MDRDRAVKLAQKFANFNKDNATQAEVELAAQHLQKIMNEHRLTELDLKPQEAKSRMAEETSAHEWKRPPYWLKWFVGKIGACFQVKPIFNLGPKPTISFLGEDTDVGLARYFASGILELPLYTMMARDWHRARKAGVDTKGYIPQWYLGFMQAVIKRLEEEYGRWREELSASDQVKERGLITIKSGAVAEYVAQRYPSLGRMSSTVPRAHSTAHKDGYEQGLKARIHKDRRNLP